MPDPIESSTTSGQPLGSSSPQELRSRSSRGLVATLVGYMGAAAASAMIYTMNDVQPNYRFWGILGLWVAALLPVSIVDHLILRTADKFLPK